MTDTLKEHDKSGGELAGQRFHMLEDIAKELAGEILFPTSFDLSIHIRQLLDDPNVSMNKITLVIGADPLLSSKILSLANSAFHAGSAPVADIKSAIIRLGLQMVRTVSLNIAMRQLLLSSKLVDFEGLTQQLWRHSLQTASACQVIASRMTKINPDTAFLAGMVHDIGAFYMIYRATQYPELIARPESLKYLVAQWHESIGISVLNALGLPEEIVEATRDHDCLRTVPETPRNLSDLVYIGNVLAGAQFEWLYKDSENEMLKRYPIGSPYLELKDDIEAMTKNICSVFK